MLKQLLSGHTSISYLAFALVPISYYVLFRTRFGLRLRAVGENPEAADTAGVSVYRMRYAGVLLSGLLAGIGGAYLSIAQNSLFTRNMTGGRGFIALAALIFGKWHPVGAFLACLLFGLAEAISDQMQGVVPITGPVDSDHSVRADDGSARGIHRQSDTASGNRDALH